MTKAKRETGLTLGNKKKTAYKERDRIFWVILHLKIKAGGGRQIA